jgi:hypothetical protein
MSFVSFVAFAFFRGHQPRFLVAAKERKEHKRYEGLVINFGSIAPRC